MDSVHSGCRGIWVEITTSEAVKPPITGMPKSLREKWGGMVNLVKQPISPIVKKNSAAGKLLNLDKTKRIQIKTLLDAEGESMKELLKKIDKDEVSYSKGAIDVVKTEDGYMILDGQHRAVDILRAGGKEININILSSKQALTQYGKRWKHLEYILK